MLFSVIVPVYKSEKYLIQCVDSILCQTYADFELILVDDGSPDNSFEICQSYAKSDARVRVIQKANGGATSARKAGLAHARGEYVLFIDGDDCIKSELLQKINDIVSKESYDVVCFGYETFPINARKASINDFREGIYNKAQIVDEIFPDLITGETGRRFPPSIWGKVFKRDIVLPILNNLSNDIILGEDSCVSYVTIFVAENLFIMYDPLYLYRVDNKSLTRGNKAFSWTEPLLRADFYLKYMPQEQFGGQVARITAHSLFNVAVSVLRTEKYNAAKSEIKRNLSDNEIISVLKKAKFKKNLKERIAVFCLKSRNVFLLKLISKVA